MTKEQFEREKIYQVTLAIIRLMYRKKLITLDEQNEIDLMMLEKYKPLLGLLYAGNP